MDEENHNPEEIKSVDVNEVLEPSIAHLTKKRKFQSEQSGLPLPKHKCCNRGLSTECDSPCKENLRVGELNLQIIRGKSICGASDKESDMESAKDSNSLSGDMDSDTSVSCESKIQSKYPKTYPHDQPSTSSVNWGSISFKNSLYSLDSRSVTKAGADRSQSPYIRAEHSLPQNDFGLHRCLNYDEHLLEFGSQIDYNGSDNENDIVQDSMDKELEDMHYTNETPSVNYVLSSGRWSVNQEILPSTQKLTIDKEFEQYFSMLML